MTKQDYIDQINMETMARAGMAPVLQLPDEDDREQMLEGIHERLDNVIRGVLGSDDYAVMLMMIGFVMGRDPATAKVFTDNDASFAVTAEIIKEAMQTMEVS